MWKSMEEVLRGLKEEGIIEDMKSESGLPPGFRFHPTDEELITYYLASKVFNTTTTTNNSFCSSINTTTNNNNATSLFLSNYFSGVQIAEVDLTRCEPWDLPERAKMGEKEWYLFSLRDRKYPSGLRTNRATETGYWKATGKDRQIYASSIATSVGGGVLIGMKKTLVFYQGRAPRGVKSKWVMHEYRLDGHFSAFRHSSKEEWVICRIFYKNGEKKASPIIHHQPLPLSPFLSSLPPLHELTSTTATTTQAVADSSLLHSLLSNPLPNFSSISASDPIFPSTTSLATPAVDISSTLFNSLPRLTANAAVTATAAAATKQQQQEQNWLDRICPQIQTQYFQNQNQYHNHDHIFDQTIDNYSHLNTYSTTSAAAAATTGDNHDEKDNNVEVSTSFGVAALDRMLLLNPAESWSFHYP